MLKRGEAGYQWDEWWDDQGSREPRYIYLAVKCVRSSSSGAQTA